MRDLGLRFNIGFVLICGLFMGCWFLIFLCWLLLLVGGLFLSVWGGFVWFFSDLIVYVARFVECRDLDDLVFVGLLWVVGCLIVCI